MSVAPRIRLIALDIDGTLLTSAHEISSATLAAVQEVTKRGVLVVLASARSPTALRLLMANLGISGFAISYTGALLCRLSPDPSIPTEVIAERRMSVTSARFVLQKALEQGISVGWYAGDVVHIPGWDAALRREYSITREQPIVTPNLVSTGESPHKVLCIAGTSTLVPKLISLAKQTPEDCIAQFSHTSYLEVTHRTVNKADALAKLGQRLGIDSSEMAAMGDQENDIGMLQFAGAGIAMGNGIPAVRAAADWITATNDRDGVAVAIERLLADGRL